MATTNGYYAGSRRRPGASHAPARKRAFWQLSWRSSCSSLLMHATLFVVSIFTIFLMFWAVLVLIGSFFRGPGQNFVFPWKDGLFFDL